MEDAKKVVRTLNARVQQKDGSGACAQMTGRLKKETKESGDGAESCGAAVIGAAVAIEAFGIKIPAQKVTKATLEGSKARVTSVVPDLSSQDYILVWQNERWLVDEVESDSPATPPEPTSKDTDRWLRNWCAIEVGMTVKEAEILMGMPTYKGLEDDVLEPRIEWNVGVYEFSAYVNKDGDIFQLENHADKEFWGKDDLAKVSCPDIRR